MAKQEKLQTTIRCLCGLLALVCVFFFLLPHDHGCDDQSCPICALVQLLEEIRVQWGGIVLLVGGWQWLSAICRQRHKPWLKSPVTLKVKLSD